MSSMAFSIAYKPTFVIVDGHNLFIRQYVANPAMNSNGEPCGGIVGTLQSLRRFLDRFKPTAMFICWDGEGGAQRRRSIRSEYKEGRKVRLNREYDFDTTASTELSNMDAQIQTVRKYIDTLGVGQIIVKGIEADDAIAYLCMALDGRKIIVSTDNDFMQLVSADVEIYNPVKDKLLKEGDILSETGCLPSNFACMKAICGDKGDNVAGVDGIGPKSLLKIVPEMASEEGMGLGKVLDLIESRQADGKKQNKKAKEITALRTHIEENMLLVSLSEPLISADAARSIRSISHDCREFKPANIRSQMIADGIQLSDDIDKHFMTLAARTSLWIGKDK